MSYSDALYDRNGHVAGFMQNGERIVAKDGRSVAWIRAGSVYDYRGEHLGWWESDHMRDPFGGVMYWKRGASTGLIHPIPDIPPIPSIPRIEPVRPIPQLPPLKPQRQLRWSEHHLPGL